MIIVEFTAKQCFISNCLFELILNELRPYPIISLKFNLLSPKSSTISGLILASHFNKRVQGLVLVTFLMMSLLFSNLKEEVLKYPSATALNFSEHVTSLIGY